MPDFTGRIKFTFYTCDSCMCAYAVEADQVVEPICPACQDEHYECHGDIEMDNPLPIDKFVKPEV